MKHLVRLLAVLAVAVGVLMGGAAAASADPLFDTNPCANGGRGAEVYAAGYWAYACVYP